MLIDGENPWLVITEGSLMIVMRGHVWTISIRFCCIGLISFTELCQLYHYKTKIGFSWMSPLVHLVLFCFR